MSSRLQSITNDVTRPVYAEHGGDVKFAPDAWKEPAKVDPALRDEARNWLAVMMRGTRMAGTQMVQRWLVSLMPFVALKGMPMDEARTKVAAYAAQMQEMPEYLFTQANLGAAARFFKWFPEYADLMAWFDKEDVAHRQRMERANIVARGRDVVEDRPADRQGAALALDLASLTAAMDEKDRLSGWAARDPRPTAPTLPYQGVVSLTMAQREEVAALVKSHADACMSWGNRMRERDLAAIKAEKANATRLAASAGRTPDLSPNAGNASDHPA